MDQGGVLFHGSRIFRRAFYFTVLPFANCVIKRLRVSIFFN